MANPTLYNDWTLPYEGQDPWHAPLEDVFNQIDTTIHSVSLIARPRSTLVVSLYAGNMLYISSATGVSMGADGVWTICSVAPYGRLVGSFSTVGSGAHVALTLYNAGFLEGTTTVGSLHGTGVNDLYFRIVGGKTGASSMVLTGNSSWMFRFTDSQNHHAMAFQYVTSVGIGNFSVELQARNVSLASGVPSRAALPAGMAITVFAAEVTPG